MSPATLTKIVVSLEDIAADLEVARQNLIDVGATAFGGSWYGDFVRGHSEKAYAAIMEVLAENEKELLKYQKALEVIENNAAKAEEASTAAFTAQRDRVDQQGTGSHVPGREAR